MILEQFRRHLGIKRYVRDQCDFIRAAKLWDTRQLIYNSHIQKLLEVHSNVGAWGGMAVCPAPLLHVYNALRIMPAERKSLLTHTSHCSKWEADMFIHHIHGHSHTLCTLNAHNGRNRTDCKTPINVPPHMQFDILCITYQ